MSENELTKVLYDFNNTKQDYPNEKTIHQIFEEQVLKTPTAIAAIFGGSSITYKELNHKANQIAVELRKRGISRNTIVGIMLDRSLEMIIGIYAILKAGGAYLPISPENPDKRIEFIVRDSGIDIILTQRKFINRINYNISIINLEDENLYSKKIENMVNINKSQDLIYMIYTSGSTGNPKGVLVKHKSVVNRLNWMQRAYPIESNYTILQKTPFVFDVSVWELFWWSFVGAKVCFMKPGFEKFPQAIISEIEQHKITTMHFVPSMLNAFLNYIENSPDVDKLASLKRIFTSGEALMPSHVNKFRKIVADRHKIALTNLYGPTEATVDVSHYDIPLEENCISVPIGKPIDNTFFYVINNDELQPVGEKGELYISGDCLAQGYFNRSDLTEERFIENPFIKGEKMYKTGDLVRWLPDGNIEYLGRLDYQIKIRGLRIELGEIEAAINNCKEVDDCVVQAVDLTETIPSLIAYIVPKSGFSIDVLKGHLREELPDYMVPNKFVLLDQMPLTSNGKADRKALNNL